MDSRYLGRDDADRELRELLDAGVDVLLEGARGVGKSTLQERWEQSPPAGWTVLRFDLQGVASPAELCTRMEGHVHLQRGWLEEAVARLAGGWRREDPWDSLESLLSHRARPACVLMLDEVQLYLDFVARQDASRARDDLTRIDALRKLGAVRLVLTGSIGLAPIARELGVTLSPSWHRMVLPPLDQAAAEALFVDRCSGVCDDAVVTAACELAGRNPRWIERLARATKAPPSRPCNSSDLEAAVERVLATTPFAQDLSHLRRHAESAKALSLALELAARPGSNRSAVLAGLQGRLSRAEAIDLLDVLRNSFFIDDQCRLVLPLLGRALRRRQS